MTDQTKIPVPGKGRSSIERATGGLDLAKLGGLPIPAELIPPKRVPRRVQKLERMEEPEEQLAAPAPTPEPQPVLAEAPVEPRMAKIERVETPAPAPQVPAIEVEPVEFKGKRYPIDRAGLREQGMIQPDGGNSGLLEEFRIVKRQLLTQSRDLRRAGMASEAQRVLVCSPLPGEGKTFTSVNLALAIAAEKECEVLLVDADFAKPSVLSTLGLPGGPGLMDALADPSVDVADCVIGTDVGGLWVLPAGNATNSDTEYLSSSRTKQVLDRLVQGAPNRFVIFDSPPALAASPAAELAKYVGQAVLVARCDKTGQGSLEDAVKLLSHCPNIQLLLNGVHFSPSGRRFGSYYGYKG